MRQKTDQKEKRQKIRDKRKGAKPDRVYKLVLKQKSQYFFTPREQTRQNNYDS